jgi:hypothetical protein
VALAAVAIARACDDEINPMETDLRAAREAMAYYLPPQNVWSENKDSGQPPRRLYREGAAQDPRSDGVFRCHRRENGVMPR